MAPPLATIDDFAAFLGEAIEDDNTRAAQLLLMASTLVRSFTARTGAEDWAELDDVPDDARTVTLLVASRMWSNPSNVSQHSETLGNYSESMSFRTEGLYLTNVEKQMLAHYRPQAGLWVQPTTRGDLRDENDTVFAPVVGSTEPIPMIQEYPR